MKKFKLLEPETPQETERYYRLRFEILRKPWDQPEQSTRDEWEDQSTHVLIQDENDLAVAAGRLQYNSEREGQIRSMAVRTDMQGHGLGSQVLKYIEEKARDKKLEYIVLDARENAVRFYEKHGYSVIGDSYLLFGVIPHFRMFKKLED